MSATITSLELTPRQDEVLRFLCDYWFRNGFPASLSDVSHALGLASPSSAMTHIRALVRKGRLRVRVLTRDGHTRTVYLPTIPFARVIGDDRNVILLGTVGGPVAFTLEAWLDWLNEHRDAVRDITPEKPALRIVPHDSARDQVA
jgi:hypothetical protein